MKFRLTSVTICFIGHFHLCLAFSPDVISPIVLTYVIIYSSSRRIINVHDDDDDDDIAVSLADVCRVCSGNLAVFTVLCDQYQLVLQRDPMYSDVSSVSNLHVS